MLTTTQPQKVPYWQVSQQPGALDGNHKDNYATVIPKRAMDREGCQTYSSGKDIPHHGQAETQLVLRLSSGAQLHD
jgi:hypothetical protein